jgi:hypothetical protein
MYRKQSERLLGWIEEAKQASRPSNITPAVHAGIPGSCLHISAFHIPFLLDANSSSLF